MQYMAVRKAKQWLDTHFPNNGLSERALRRLIAQGRIPSLPSTNRVRLIDVDKLPEMLERVQ